MRAGIYTRVSRDKTGAGLAVDRQERLCRDLCETNGWTVVEVFSDNDVSAYSGKERPGYKALLEAMTSGALDVVVCWHTDRLHRSPMELEGYITASEPHGVPTHSVTATPLDLATPTGRLVARLMGATARHESEHKAERVSAQKAYRAGNGVPHKGRHRQFGYSPDWDVIESEAVVIREMFTRRANGESLTAICKDLTNRGVKTVAGNDWKSGTLSETLKKTLYKGRVSYKGEEVSDSIYPALVDADLFDRAQTEMANDSKGTNARKYLLSGILVCGLCLTEMKGNPSNNMYRCAANYGGCGRMSIRISIADQWALYKTMEKFNQTRSKAPESVRDYSGEVQALMEKIGRLQTLAAEGVMSMPDAVKQIRSAQSEVAKLEKAKAKELPRQTRATQAYLDFNKMNLSQKRIFITDYVANIKVGPTISRGHQPFNPGRLEFFYTDGTSEVPVLGEDNPDN